MEKLTVMQEMRYNLLERTNYDLKAAKECLDFIAGDPNKLLADWLETQPITATSLPKQLPDGTYLIATSGEVIPYYGWVNVKDRLSCKGVGIVEGQKSLIVSLHDPGCFDTELTTKECGTLFIKDFHDAVTDWNGEASTKDIGEHLRSNIILEEGEFIPSLGQMYFIMQHFKEINAAIEVVGGSPILEDWYWTSTQYCSMSAWYLDLCAGSPNYIAKASKESGNYVRPVSAFL